MKPLHKLLLLLLFVLMLPWATAGAERLNRALLIGCDRFLSAENTNPASFNNVGQMAATLSGGSMNLQNLVTHREGLGSLEELSTLLVDAFQDADSDDVSYFYISTHGQWQQNQPNETMTLLLSDGDEEVPLTAQQLRDLFDTVPGTKVLIIDACHSGAMIGKGVPENFSNLFASPDYKIICSSGGSEESWFWSGPTFGVGEGYFSGSLVTALSAGGGFAADDNADGVITLTELKRFLRQNHGASTVQCYPEEDDFPLFTYDPSAYTAKRKSSILENIAFESSVLTAGENEISLSFTMLRSAQVVYQLVYQRNGKWDFDHANVLYDNGSSISAYGETSGWLSPGYQERTIRLDLNQADGFGYVLFQILTIKEDQVAIAASHLLCVPPDFGNPLLSITAPDTFTLNTPQELSFVVNRAFPCELTVTVETLDGQLVRRLCSRQPTRPEQLLPTGSFFAWNGRLADGSTAEPLPIRLHAKAYVGDSVFECYSDEIILK